MYKRYEEERVLVTRAPSDEARGALETKGCRIRHHGSSQ